MNKHRLEIIVFISGAVVMVFELVGSRVLAPFLGSSIFTWTSIIGVILGSLSLGYWLGGRWADREVSYTTLSLILVVAAGLVALMDLFKDPFLFFLSNAISDIRASSFLGALALFSLPSILLGTISPYAVKLKIINVQTSGSIVGNLYAISTLGSIVGTFLAGFWLIPSFGSTRIIYILALVLALCSFLAAYKKNIKTRGLLLAVFIILSIISPSYFTQFGIKDFDTRYSRVLIYDTTDKKTQRPVRLMNIDSVSNSGIFLDGEDLLFDYFKYCGLAGHFQDQAEKALLIGGAGYVYPQYFLKNNPRTSLDVVEIDPKLTGLAREYFGLQDSPRLQIFHEDGRMFLNRNEKKYDLVFMDAFNSLFSLPYQLTTQEAISKIYGALNDRGVVLVNLISILDPQKNDFLRAEYSTYRSVFPQVYLFPIISNSNPEIVQNILLVALKSDQLPSFTSENKEYNEYLSHLLLNYSFDPKAILTDEHAPVDYQVAKMINSLKKQ
ncbi:MAG: spermidine synthase [Parcubacteria group bacterium]|nr:MAG: spermidine synthase [Parcubacteria group bacterium]